jgi:anti-sigma regulatory factor (Ser/Thr protein kinase)
VRVPSASSSFPAAPGSIGRARQFTGRTLLSWGADGLEDDVRAVASELATNALLHARTRFTLTLTLDGDTLRLTMADGSPTHPRMRRFDSTESTTGRGLRIVAQLTQAWGVEARGEGKEVWCEFRLQSGGAAPAEGRLQGFPDAGQRDLDVETLLAMYGDDDDGPLRDPQVFHPSPVRVLASIGVVA